MSTPTPTPATAGSTLTPSLVRTLVPFLAGLIGTWLVELAGAEVDTATVGALLTAGIGYAYYVVVRFLEVYASDKWGYILGLSKNAPVAYGPPSTEVVDVQGRHEAGVARLAQIGFVVALVGVVLLVVAAVQGSELGVGLTALVIGVGVVGVIVDSRPEA